jgi:acyl-CoA thioester hydrolase
MTLHEFEFRVAYADTDRMGVVYYGNYFMLFERGRTELLRNLGFRYRDFEETLHTFLPAMDAQCSYLAPAKYDDLIRIRTWVAELGAAHVTFRYEIHNAENGRLLARGSTKHASVNQNWKPVRIPSAVRAVLRSAQVADPGSPPASAG